MKRKIIRIAQQEEAEDEAEDIENRELNKSWWYLLRQFLWPTVDKKYRSDSMVTYYPSRLFFALYLALFAIIILFELQFSAHLWLHQHLDLLQSYMESIESTINNEWYILPQRAVDAMYYCIDYIHWLKVLLIAFTHGLLFGSCTALIIIFYFVLIVFRAWNKKLINMRRQMPTFRYNENNKHKYCVWYSSNLIATIAASFVIGYIYLTASLIFLFGIFIYVYFWEITLPIYSPLAIVFIVYYVLIDNFVFKKFLMNQKGSIRRTDNKFFEKCFKLLLIINDFMNIPIALCSAILRVLSGALFIVVSYLRPDISMNPRGFKHRDIAHCAFVASVRLLIEREQNYLIQFKSQYTEHCSGNIAVETHQSAKGSESLSASADHMENSLDFHAL